MPGLRRADCSTPGIRRVRRGRGFSYLDETTGEPIAETDALARIRALAIPPAWEEVWISPFPNGHIQAVGTDARGRKQYRYHDRWRELRDREKFDRMLEFGKALPICGERPTASCESAGPRASASSPVRSDYSTAGSSGAAARTTRRRTRPTAWRRCRSGTCGSSRTT
jgi:DNA topoisomerase I